MRTTCLSGLNNVMEYEDKHLKMAGGYNVQNVMSITAIVNILVQKAKHIMTKVFLAEPLSNMKLYFKYS